MPFGDAVLRVGVRVGSNYLSLEFLIGRTMQNALLSMDLEDNYRKVCVVAG